MHSNLAPVSKLNSQYPVQIPEHPTERDALPGPSQLSFVPAQALGPDVASTLPLSSSWSDSSPLWKEFSKEAVRNGTFLTPEKLGRDLEAFSARAEFETTLNLIHADNPDLSRDGVRLKMLVSLGACVVGRLRAIVDDKSHGHDLISERSAARTEVALATAKRSETSAGFLDRLKTAADHMDEVAGRELDLNFARYFSMNLFDTLLTRRVSRGALEIIDEAGKEINLSIGAACAVAAIFVIDETLAVTPENWGKQPRSPESGTAQARLAMSDPLREPAVEFCRRLQRALTDGSLFSDRVRERVANGANRDDARADEVRTMALEVHRDTLEPAEFAKVVRLLRG
ncbi:MAG: hypothetical protein Q8R63_06715 [Ramlibacter sp.]|nr:hypothetical protein [Ramlibacter sp.]